MVTALHVKAPQSLQEQLTELSDPEGGRYTGPRIQDLYKGNGLQPAISHMKGDDPLIMLQMDNQVSQQPSLSGWGTLSTQAARLGTGFLILRVHILVGSSGQGLGW